MPGLLDLALETREKIYGYVVVSRLPLLISGTSHSYSHDYRWEGVCRRDLDLSILLVSKKISFEAMVVFYNQNTLRIDLDTLADHHDPHSLWSAQPPPFASFRVPRTRRERTKHPLGEESQTEISREVIQRFSHIELAVCENHPVLRPIWIPPRNSSIEALLRALGRPPAESWQASGQKKDFKIVLVRWQGPLVPGAPDKERLSMLPSDPTRYDMLCLEYPQAVHLLKRVTAQTGQAMTLLTQNRGVVGAPNPVGDEEYIQYTLKLIGPSANRPFSPSLTRFASNCNAWS